MKYSIGDSVYIFDDDKGVWMTGKITSFIEGTGFFCGYMYNVEYGTTIGTFYEKDLDDWNGGVVSRKSCCCGAASVNSKLHSYWCDIKELV